MDLILQDKNKKKVHKSSRKPGEESIVQIDPDEDLSDYSNEYRIKQRLLRNYDKTTRPVRNDTTATTLYVGMSLFHILDTVRCCVVIGEFFSFNYRQLNRIMVFRLINDPLIGKYNRLGGSMLSRQPMR